MTNDYPKLLKETKIKRTEMVRETSASARSVSAHESVMRLYQPQPKKEELFIEWDIPTLETVEHIGLWFENKTLVDYDGVFALPKEAIAFIRAAGYVVPDEFTSTGSAA